MLYNHLNNLFLILLQFLLGYDNNNSNYEIDTNGVYIVDQCEKFTLPLAKAYYKGQLVSDKVEPKPKTIDTNGIFRCFFYLVSINTSGFPKISFITIKFTR